MNDNYLWDKSGEPDEEIQHLERLLSEFRYQPRPLVLPEATPKRMIFSYFQVAQVTTLRYAAIAAVILLALGLGIWFGVRSTPNTDTVATAPQAPTPAPTIEQPAAPKPDAAVESPAPQMARQLPRHQPKPHAVKHSAKRVTSKTLEVEGEIAKEKLLYALQITSQKLDLIARKIQTDTN